MKTSKAEVKYAKLMAKIAGREAKKLGLKPANFSGGWAGQSFIMEVEFSGIHESTVCQGSA